MAPRKRAASRADDDSGNDGNNNNNNENGSGSGRAPPAAKRRSSRQAAAAAAAAIAAPVPAIGQPRNPDPPPAGPPAAAAAASAPNSPPPPPPPSKPKPSNDKKRQKKKQPSQPVSSSSKPITASRKKRERPNNDNATTPLRPSEASTSTSTSSTTAAEAAAASAAHRKMTSSEKPEKNSGLPSSESSGDNRRDHRSSSNRSRSRSSSSDADVDVDAIPRINPDAPRHEGEWYWLMKAEPESRFENGIDVKFSIDDLKGKKKPEGWDGIRAYAARNHMRNMNAGDKAFFYHSNCKDPGIAGIMEIVKEFSEDTTARQPGTPYYDPSSTKENPRWSLVHVAFRKKFAVPITLRELRELGKPGGPLEHMQMLKQSRLSVSRVSSHEWRALCSMADDKASEAGLTHETVVQTD